jgi:hypothetical protein
MKKLVISVENDFVYEAVQREAEKRHLSIAQMATEILEDWYDDLFLEEDLAEHDAAMAEYREKGGVEASECFHKLNEEAQSGAISS